MRRVSAAEQSWLRKHYETGTIYDTLDAFEHEFGWRPSKRTLYVRAHKLGLRKLRQDPEFRGRRAETLVRWSREPEMEAWMLEYDGGRPHEDVSAAFHERFGIWLSRGQINIFRARHGIQTKAGAGGRPARPVGYERRAKGGILVKVAEKASVPMSKDNWRFKHHIAYEEAWGPVPAGYVVCAVDGDSCNCRPENLAAVPRRCLGAVNRLRGGGRVVGDPRGVPGRRRGNRPRHRHQRRREPGPEEVRGVRRRVRRDRGAAQERQAPHGDVPCLPLLGPQGERREGGDGEPTVCAVCGKVFPRSQKRQRKCPECIARSPKMSAARQRGEGRR